MNNALEIKNFSVKYGEEIAINNFNAVFGPNTFYVILGGSGSGKTTVLKSIGGLLDKNAKTSGEILWHGQSMNSYSMQKLFPKKLGFIFQDPHTSFDPRKTIGYQFNQMLYYNGIKAKSERKKEITKSLLALGFSDVDATLKKYPFELSGGMQQRIIIAMATIFTPDILLSDEPTSALDSLNQLKVLNLLCDLREKKKFSVIFVTHNIALASQYADCIFIMKDGNLLESGSSKEIINNPKNEYTKALIRAAENLNERNSKN